MAIGSYAVERDYSHYVAYASRTILAVVGTATKGPIGEPTVVTSSQDLVNKFGALTPDCLGLYAGQYFLSQSSKLYFVRAASASAAAAKTAIAGLESDESTEIESAITVEMIEKGTFSNQYILVVTAGLLDDTYTVTIKTSRANTLETIQNKTLDELATYESAIIRFKDLNTSTSKLTVGTYEFTGGSDGIEDITSGDYISAANTLASESLDINLLAIPGVSDASVINAVLALAEGRGDTLYIIDPPKGLTREGIIQWVEGSGAYDHTLFNSSYGAVYYDWFRIYDSLNKIQVEVPPSVGVCATYAYSDRISDIWIAPAGLTRGIVRGVISPMTSLTRAEVELLYDHNINSIYEDPQVGLVLWGQKTLHRENTALNRVNVRRLMNYMKKVITAACNHLVFEPNDRVTWNDFEMKIIPTLENIKTRRGIYEYKVIKGESIVTAEDIDNYKMPCMVLVRPTKAAEEIPVYFVITSTGAEFNEVLEANGVVVV